MPGRDSIRSNGAGKFQLDPRPFAWAAVDIKLRIVQTEDLPGNGQAETRTAAVALVGFVRFIEAFPDERQIFRRNSGAGILNDTTDTIGAILIQSQADAGAGRRMFDGVIKKNEQELDQPVAIAGNWRQILRDLVGQRDFLGLGQRFDQGENMFGHGRQLDRGQFAGDFVAL